MSLRRAAGDEKPRMYFPFAARFLAEPTPSRAGARNNSVQSRLSANRSGAFEAALPFFRKTDGGCFRERGLNY